jgi:hypothetical protein
MNERLSRGAFFPARELRDRAMMYAFRILALLLPCLLAVPAASPAHAAEPQVWISSNDPTHGGAADFWQMFAADAPWQSAKRHVAVFGIARTSSPTVPRTSSASSTPI